VRAWTVLISLKIGTDCGRLWARWWTVGFHKVRGLSWPAEELLASTGLCSVQALSYTSHCEYTRPFYRPSFVSVPFMVLVWKLPVKYTVPWVKSDHCTWYWTTVHVRGDWSARVLLHIREVLSSGLVPETDFLEVFGYHQGLMFLFLSEAHFKACADFC